MKLVYYNPKTDNIDESGVAYYLFEGERCPICKELKEKLNKIDMDITVHVVDAYADLEFSKANNLVGLPCFITKKNAVEDDRFYGNRSVERIISFINEE